MESDYKKLEENDWIMVQNKYSCSSIKISECSGSAAPVVIYAAPNTHYIYPKSVIPALKTEINLGVNKIVSEIQCKIK